MNRLLATYFVLFALIPASMEGQSLTAGNILRTQPSGNRLIVGREFLFLPINPQYATEISDIWELQCKQLPATYFVLLPQIPTSAEGQSLTAGNIFRTQPSGNRLIVGREFFFLPINPQYATEISNISASRSKRLPTLASGNAMSVSKATHTRRPRPRLSAMRILKQTSCGFSGGIIGIVAGALVCGPIAEDITRGKYSSALAGAYAGYTIGSAIGVCAVGNTKKETGSFWAALGGSFLASMACILPAPIGAVIGFNLTRRYRE